MFVLNIISNLIKFIFLSERNISKIRKQTSLSMASEVYDKVQNYLVIKYTVFFNSWIIFLGFFWILLSSFGAVYQNTQMFIFKNALISFAFTIIYPLFINIFPCILRIFSLNSKNE